MAHGNTSWTLTRDNAGRITGKTETVGGSSSTYRYSYDSVGRLRTVTKDGALVEEYRYNAVGTRIYEMNALRGISGRSMSYSAEDRLLTAGGATYQYDVDGYLTTKTQGGSLTTYAYSSRGESLHVVLPDSRVIEYVHDPLGRRIAKKISGSIIEKYLWQGLTRLLAVYDGSDNLLVRFEYADGRMPVAMTTGGATYYLAYDQVGSLRVVADSSGTVVKRIDYDSFGNIISDSAPSFGVPFGFAGGLYDKDTSLVRFGFRDYDPDTGRWTAKDRIFFNGGDANLYGYVLNGPVSWVDPLGLAKGDWWDPRTYVALAFSTSVAGQGTTTSTEGVEQETATFFNLVGASLDIYIGRLPSPCDVTGEIGFGLGRHLGAGYFFGRPDAAGDMEVGGLVFHFGIGVGTPAYVGGTFPAK